MVPRSSPTSALVKKTAGRRWAGFVVIVVVAIPTRVKKKLTVCVVVVSACCRVDTKLAVCTRFSSK